MTTRFNDDCARRGSAVRGGARSPASARADVQINGAGATFPYPIYSKWFDEYNKLHPNVQINYQSIGSGGGIRQVTNADRVLRRDRRPDDRRAAAGGAGQDPALPDGARRRRAGLQHSRTSAPSSSSPGPVLADIFLGKITKWNDPAIAEAESRREAAGDRHHRRPPLGRLGHDLHLGGLPRRRCRPSGRPRSASTPSVNWPAGVGGKGNEGVAGLVKQTPGSIGYVELIYALQNKIELRLGAEHGRRVRQGVGRVGHGGGRGGREQMPADFRVSITNAPGKGVYPISSFTWLLLYENPKDKAQAKIMVDFMKWALTDGQKFAGRPRLRAAAGRSRQARAGGAGESEDHAGSASRGCSTSSCVHAQRRLGFRLGTGLFGLVLDPDRRRRSASS